MKWEKQLTLWMEKDTDIMEALRLIQQLNLREGAIAAGFVRNFVWDRLHGYSTRTPLNDVDVIYYDPETKSEEQDQVYERELTKRMPQYQWQVRNQARMHLRNQHAPYRSISDAMMRWPETATAVAVRLNPQHRLEIIAPLGLDDLFGLIVRRGPLFEDVDYFIERIEQKNWRFLWPKLDLVTSASELHAESERTIHIRLLKSSDVVHFAELRLEGLRLYPEYFGESPEEAHEFPLENLRAKLTSTSDRFVLGAWSKKDELVGMLGFYRESGSKFRHKGVLWGMYVTPSYQGLGIGLAMLQAAIKQVRKMKGVEKVIISVVSSNLPAKRLYEQFGFQGYGLEKRSLKWNNQYWDEEFMYLQISS